MPITKNTIRLIFAAFPIAAFFLVSCTQPPPEPTVDIGATVQAAVEKALPTATNTPEPDFQATVHAGIAGTMEVLARTPSPTPAPLPAPTPVIFTSPTITVDMPLNIKEGSERVAAIQFSDLIPGDSRYLYVVLVSHLSCEGTGMDELLSLGESVNVNEIRSVKIAASCTPGEHLLKVSLYRHAILVAENRIRFTVASPTPTPSPVPTATHTSIPTNTPTTTSTATPTLTSTATPTSTHTSTPIPTPTPPSTNTPAPTSTYTPVPSPTPSTSTNTADIVEQARAAVVRIEGPTSSGSGFVVDPEGHILTNEHVISGQSRLTVTFDNGASLVARVIASDAARDIALLKVAATTTLNVLPLATSVREGEEVIALGYPLGGDLRGSMTVTKGIVSAFRNIRGTAHIQTDAAINPGNSGGPLLNTKGEVVGMNTSVQREIQGEDYSAQGIGFAIKFDVLVSRLFVMKYGQSSPPTPVPTPAVVATQAPGYVFGLVNGSIDHNPEDGFIDVYRAEVSVSDAIIEATFFNPYSTQVGEWSSGFLFRSGRSNTFHVVVVSSNGAWYHYLRTGDVDTEQDLAAEFSDHIDTTRYGSNHIRIIANGSEGWLFINGELAGELDLNGLTGLGGVSTIGSYFRGHGISGESTRFEDFTIRRLTKAYGPRDGSIELDPDDGFIDEEEAGVWVKDGIIEAVFSNPYSPTQGDWSSGFLFRSGENTFHAAVIQEDGRWHHDLRLGETDDTHDLAEQYSPHIRTATSNRNHLRVITIGAEGWFFINDQFVAKLDLSGLQATGEVSAIASYFTGDGIDGYSTRFENFTIWSAD